MCALRRSRIEDGQRPAHALVAVLVPDRVLAARERRVARRAAARGAAEQAGVNTITVAGGVSMNSRLREKLPAAWHGGDRRVIFALPSLCTDNAAMIAALAYHKVRGGAPADFSLDVAPSCGLGIAA